MLDLCKLDEQGLVNNNLRRLWRDNHGYDDPMASARNAHLMRSRLMKSGLVMLLGACSLSCIMDRSDPMANVTYVVSIASVVSAGIWALHALVEGIVAKKETRRFSRCLEDALDIWWKENVEVVATWGLNELRQKTVEVLFREARCLQDFQMRQKPQHEIDEQRRCFKEAFNTFKGLGLAADTWDPYFQRQKPEEKSTVSEPAPTPSEIEGWEHA